MKITTTKSSINVIDSGKMLLETVNKKEDDAIFYSEKDNKMVYLSGTAVYIYRVILNELDNENDEISSKEIARMITAAFDTEGLKFVHILSDVEETIYELVKNKLIIAIIE